MIGFCPYKYLFFQIHPHFLEMHMFTSLKGVMPKEKVILKDHTFNNFKSSKLRLTPR